MDVQAIIIAAVHWVQSQPIIAGSVAGAAVLGVISTFISDKALGAMCFAAGKSVSVFMTRRLGRRGRKIEDYLQHKAQVAFDCFSAGLDADDGNGIEKTATDERKEKVAGL